MKHNIEPREIKFRAWDGEKILEGTSIYDLGADDIGVSFRGKYIKYEAYPNGRLEFMQFTGLLDKNGKEIYEGDIVKYQYGSGSSYDSEHTDVVEWDNNLTGFSPFNAYDSDCEQYVRLESVEVIGNIYESPELFSKLHESVYFKESL